MEDQDQNFGKEIFCVGNWVLTNDYIFWNCNKQNPFHIHKSRFWEVFTDEQQDKLNWPIHLTDKKWLKKLDIYHFNIVFLYAIDYFQKMKPKNCIASIYKTLDYQNKSFST